MVDGERTRGGLAEFSCIMAHLTHSFDKHVQEKWEQLLLWRGTLENVRDWVQRCRLRLCQSVPLPEFPKEMIDRKISLTSTIEQIPTSISVLCSLVYKLHCHTAGSQSGHNHPWCAAGKAVNKFLRQFENYFYSRYELQQSMILSLKNYWTIIFKMHELTSCGKMWSICPNVCRCPLPSLLSLMC